MKKKKKTKPKKRSLVSLSFVYAYRSQQFQQTSNPEQIKISSLWIYLMIFWPLLSLTTLWCQMYQIALMYNMISSWWQPSSLLSAAAEQQAVSFNSSTYICFFSFHEPDFSANLSWIINRIFTLDMLPYKHTHAGMKMCFQIRNKN